MQVRLSNISISPHLTRSFAEIGLPVPDCALILDAAEVQLDSRKILTLHQVLSFEVRENRFQKIATSCPALDQLLTGGVRIGHLTEIHGAAGCAKTQFCMQLCVNVQMPKSWDGQDADALFIDCESGFSSKRLLQIAAAPADQWYDPPVDPIRILHRVHVTRCTSADILRAFICHKLCLILDRNPQVSDCCTISPLSCWITSVAADRCDWWFWMEWRT